MARNLDYLAPPMTSLPQRAHEGHYFSEQKQPLVLWKLMFLVFVAAKEVTPNGEIKIRQLSI